MAAAGAPDAEPAGEAGRLTIDGLLGPLDLLGLTDALKDEDPEAWLRLGRPTLLNHLRSLGLTKLAERQRIANAVGRTRRLRELPAAGPEPGPSNLGDAASELRRLEAAAAHDPGTRSPSASIRGEPVFTCTVVEGQIPMNVRTPPDKATKAAVRRALLSESAAYEYDNGHVRSGLRGRLRDWTAVYGAARTNEP